MKGACAIDEKQYLLREEKAVCCAYLQKKLCISFGTVRRLVNQLRNNGSPICSGDNGYYYAADREELIASIRQMTSRIKEISKARRGLIKALEHFPDDSDQLRFNFDDEAKEG